MFVIFSVLSIFLVVTIQCFSPNCIPENQFRNFDFPVDACAENIQGKCKFQQKGYFKSVGEVSLVKIRETTVIPTCAFVNADSLRHIYGVNSNIKVLATGAFKNLPNLEAIHLAFNRITEVRKDIFHNVSVKLLDLSWNKIVFVDPHAFKEVANLEHLNLSRNSLVTIAANSLPESLIILNLAHNLLKIFALNSHSFRNLTHIDASNNVINQVAISFKYPAESIDLTNNRLDSFDYMDISYVNKFKMGNNLFEEAPNYLENINAREIDIYPNPWICEKLFLLWDTLISFNIRLAPREPGKIPPPECFRTGLNSLVTVKRSTDCLDDHECPSSMACRAKKCWDPCEESLCHKSNFCETKNHVFNCSCSIGLLADPLDIQSECKKVECYTSDQCLDDYTCLDQKCVIFYITAVPIEPEEQDSSTEAGPEVTLPWWFEEIPSLAPPAPSRKPVMKF